MSQRTVTIVLPSGYESPLEFANDCEFELAEIGARELLDMLLSRIDFDGMDPGSFTIAELRRAV